MTEQAAGLLVSAVRIPDQDKWLHNQRMGLIQINRQLAHAQNSSSEGVFSMKSASSPVNTFASSYYFHSVCFFWQAA